MAGVNVKMGVSGVAQFKQSINQAKQNMKTLDAQLALTEKQYKATGDAETYMQQKTEQLKAKLEEQKAIAANAEKALSDMTEKGVDKSSKAFQDMLRTLIQAKGDMLDTENAMGGLAEKADDAGNEVNTMNNQLKDIGKDVKTKNVTDALDKITAGMTNVITKAWKMGEAIVDATLGAGSWADEIKTTSDMYKDTLNLFGGGADATETLQRMRKTANLIDTDVDTILNAQDKLRKNSEKQDKEAMGAWAYLGLDPNGKNPVDLFWETGEAIAALGDEEDKVAYAQKLFGKSWRELLPLFNAGKDEYEKTMQAWSVVENDQIDNLGKMDDQYQKLQGEWETFKNELLSTFSGPLTTGMEKITSLFEELNKYLDTDDGKEMMQSLSDAVSSLFEDLKDVQPKDVLDTIKGLLDSVVDGLKWIKNNREKVVGAVEAFVGAWALLEGAKGVGIALQLFRGLGWIGGGEKVAVAASGSGAMTGVKNLMAGASLKTSGLGSTFSATNGAAVLDWFFNSTAAGTQVQNKIAEVLGQKKQFADVDVIGEIKDSVKDSLKGEGTAKDSIPLYRLAVPFADIERQVQNASDPNANLAETLLNPIGWLAPWLYLGRTGNKVDQTSLGDPAGFRALERMTEVAEDLNNEGSQNIKQGGEDVSDAAKEMKKLPQETGRAVSAALNGARVVINGQELSAVVGEIMAQWVNSQ